MSDDYIYESKLEKESNYSNLNPKMDLPCTPLERGEKNYFPEGVKGKTSHSPISQNHACEFSFSKSASSSSELSYFYNKRRKHHKRHRLSDEKHMNFSSSVGLINEEGATSEHDDVFLKSFFPSEQNSKDIFDREPNSQKAVAKSPPHMRCESVEPFFPDIFSTSIFSLRPASAKSVTTDDAPPVEVPKNNEVVQPVETVQVPDVIGSLPSCSSIDTMTSVSETAEDQLLSSENSVLSEDNNESGEKTRRSGFKVYIRIKPLDDQDVGAGPASRLKCVQVKGQQNLVLCTRPSLKKENTGNNHWFKFDHVLDEASSQKDTYDVTTQPLVEKSLQGFHSCLITYGSPGSGKSHALFGRASSGKYKGLIIRAAEAMMGAVDPSDSKSKSSLSMSFIQIYNEKIYDVLDPSATDNIKFHDHGDVHTLEGITEWPVTNTEDVTKQLRRNPNRLRDAGRSHTIFTLLYRKEESHDQEQEDGVKRFRTVAGRLDFVDLAGVNRSTKHSTHDSTGNNATAKANRSLQVFSNVIWSLTDVKKPQAPPYRDSRLTRLLREALGGNCVTHLLVTASCCPNSAHETLNCLAFAKRASGVKNFPASYVSVEKIINSENKVSPEDEKSDVFSDHDQEVSKLKTTKSSQNISVKKKSSPETAKLSSPSQDKLGSTLPPINQKTVTSSNNENSQANKEQLSRAATATNILLNHEVKIQSEKSDHVLSKKNLSKDSSEQEGSERRRSEKIRRSRKKSKAKHDSNVKSASFVDQDSVNMKASLILPQIDTPDVPRHHRRASIDQCGTDEKLRGKSSSYKGVPFADGENTRNFEVHKRVKERPGSSHSLVPSIDNSPSPRIAEVPFNKQEQKETVCNQSAGSNQLLFALAPPLANCCEHCQEREDKIKRDYDRMILFSKKDRDMKQTKIEELEVMLKKARSESAPLSELQCLKEEKVKDHQALKKQKELIETYRVQLSTMIGLNEWKTLQELRRKDAEEMEGMKQEISSLKKNLEDQINGATKMLAKKSEQIAEFEAEISILRNKILQSNTVKKSEYELLQTQLRQVSAEKEEETSRHLNELKETTFKLTCATSQISQMQESKVEIEKIFEEEKQSLKRELSILSQQVAELTKSKKKQEILQNISLKCDSSTNTEDLKSKLNGLACAVHCLRCAAQRSIDDKEFEEVTNIQDAELRILLVQDTKNRELLLQLKRERNLLRDVMKIMYCRQWFTEEGNPHVKRTLRKVGIDTRELAVIKKQ